MSESFDLNRRLIEHSKELMERSKEYSDLAHDAVMSRNSYDMAKSRARLVVRTDPLMSKWTVAEKDAQVLILCESEMVSARVSEAMLDACKMRLRAVEASLGAIQSQAKLLRTEVSLAGYS